jgi:Ca2+-binding EF-hand superfamily protein
MKDVSISKLVNGVFANYDSNKNNVIELDNNERAYVRTDVSDGIDQTIVTVASFSNDRLFLKADKNNDKKVSKDELENVFREYDHDKNGKLSERCFLDTIFGKAKGELDRFNKDMPQDTKILDRKIIHHPDHDHFHDRP